MFRTPQKYLWKTSSSIESFHAHGNPFSPAIQLNRSFLLTPSRSKSANINSRNYYDLLGIDKAATQKDIKKAFVKLSKEYHPDSNASDKSLHEKFVKINEAFTVLSKQSSRETYDLSLNSTVRSPYSSRPTPSDRRNPFNEPNWRAAPNDKAFYEMLRRRMEQDRYHSHKYASSRHFQGTYFAPASVILIIIGFGVFIHALQWRIMQFSDPQYAVDPRTRHYRAYREWQRLSALKEAESMPMQTRESSFEDDEEDEDDEE